MSTLNAILFIPVTQTGNTVQSCQTTDDSTMTAQFALLKAGKAGTSGALSGVICRWGQYGVIQQQLVNGVMQNTDAGGNFHINQGALIDSFGNAGGSLQKLVSGYNLGAPANKSTADTHAAITMPVANSTNGILAATTLTAANQSISAGITNPSGKVPTIAGSTSSMVGPVTINYTDLNGVAGLSLTLALNGTTTVSPTLDMIPGGVNTIQSINFPPYTLVNTETVVVGYSGLVTVTGFTQPDIPRVFSATGNASGITGNQIVLGTNYIGNTILDTIALSGASTVNGTKAMKTIIATLTPAKTNSSGDTVSIDRTNILGLPYKMDHDAVLNLQFGVVHEATRPTVTFDALLHSGNTILPSSTPDGSKAFVVDFIRSDAPLGLTTQ